MVLRELQDKGNTNMWRIYKLLVNPAYRKTLNELIEEILGKNKETLRDKIISDTHNPILICFGVISPLTKKSFKQIKNSKEILFIWKCNTGFCVLYCLLLNL